VPKQGVVQSRAAVRQSLDRLSLFSLYLLAEVDSSRKVDRCLLPPPGGEYGTSVPFTSPAPLLKNQSLYFIVLELDNVSSLKVRSKELVVMSPREGARIHRGLDWSGLFWI
jgi:hypothetical protein